MATKRWRGDAPKVAQVDSITPANVGIGDIFTCTINGKSISFTATAATVANVTAGLTAAWNASTIPEFMEITAADATTYMSLTADTAGKPFTVTTSTTDGNASNTQTLTRAAVTANSGPNVVSLGANWDTGTAPVHADDIVFDYGSSDVLYDLDQNSVTPATITIGPGYSGNIGRPVVNSDNTSYTYFEYRETYLKYGNSGDAQTVTVTINGGGGRIKLSQGTAQAVWLVTAKTQRAESLIPQVLLKGTHASNSLTVNKGDVGVAFFASETSALVTLNVGYQSDTSGDSAVWLGGGVTLTAPTITQTGGTLTVNSAITSTSTVNIYGGTYTQQSGGIAAGLLVAGGRCVYNSTGTIGGAPIVSGSGILDFSQDLRAKTVTNAIDCYGAKCKVLDPNKVVSSMVVDLDQIKNAENFDLGVNIRLSRSVPS